MRDIEFQKHIRRYIGKPFYVGDPYQGWDCLNSLRDYFKQLGIEFPNEYMGWTWGNYAERWNRGEGNGILKEFTLSLGSAVDPNYIDNGDIIVFVFDGKTSLGQYVGSGNFKAHHPTMGCIVLPLRFFRSSIAGVRRISSGQLAVSSE